MLSPRDKSTSEPDLSRGTTVETSTITAEWTLLLECARPHPDPKHLNEFLRRPLDWPALLELAEEHRVLGLVAIQLRDAGETAMPLEISRQLKDRHRTQVLFTLRLTAEMYRLLDCFGAAGVEALIIKGPVLSIRGYGDAGSRQYSDLDLIVRDRDILRVTELMMSLGYEPTVSLSAIRAKKIPGEYNFRQKGSQLLIEFHTERTFRYHPQPLPLERIFGRQMRVELDGHAIPALSAEDEFVLMCIHGAKHFWERLSYIADVAALVSRQKLDWKKVDAAGEEVGAERMVCLGLQLAQDVLGVSLPEQIRARLQSDAALPELAAQITRWLPAAGSEPPGLLERAIFRVRMHGRTFAGLSYLLRLSFSPTEEDWASGEPRKRPWLIDALGRPFRLARKYTGDGKS